MSELQKIIKSKYDNDWIALSNENKIFQLTNLVSSQKKHYGFKPQGLWLGKGDNWLQYIKDNDMTDWLTEYCSAFSIKLGSNILELKDKEDYVNFTKRYSETPMKIKWEVVAKKYDGIIAYAPRRFAFDNSLSWTYGWDITSACVWNDNGIENVDLIFNGCNDENFETFRGGGQIHYSCVLTNQKELLSRFGQVHENLFSHHSTIEYKPTDIKGLEVGKPIDLKITGRLTNDKVDVLLVDNPYSKNKYPHITLSTAKDVKPVASNFEIENNLDDVIPLDGVLKGVITVCRFEQGGEIIESQLNEKEKKYIDYLKNKDCYKPLSMFQSKFLVDLENIIELLKKIDNNFTIDTNPNNFGYTFEKGGTMCLFDIEDVQDNGGAWELIEEKYSTIEPFENPIDNDNYELLGTGEASQGAVFLDKRDGSVLKLTASPFEVLGTHKVMEAQKKDENYLYYFPFIDSIKNVGKLDLVRNVHTKVPSSNNYFAIRRSDIIPFDSYEQKQVDCLMIQIIDYWKIVENQIGYSGEKLLNEDFLKGLDIVGKFWTTTNYKKGGNVVTWKHKYNKKYGYSKNESHSLKEISKDTGVSMKGLRQIYNKGIGAYKTNPSSVRPNVTSKEQWAMARVYSSVMGGKASKVDAKELKMEKGGKLFDKRKKELQIIAEGEKTIRNSKRGYDKYLTILKDLKNGLKKDKEINLIGVYLKIQDDIRRYNDLVELYTPIVDKDNRTTAYIDNLIRVNEPNLKIYPYTIDELEDVYYKVRGYKAGLKNSFKQGGEVCTYDFDGYDLAKMKCGNDVDVYLIPAEYDRVSIFLFENHFPLWLYYNYLSRIVISKEDVFTFKKQCLEKFKITNPVQVLVKPSNDKFWKKTPFGKPRSFMAYTEIKGVIQTLEIVLVQDGDWENQFKERTSGLTLPNPRGVQLSTVIHEFAHLVDVIRYNEKNPNEEIIVTHQRGFLVALTDILIASKRKEIPIVSQVDNKALIIQRALQNPSFVEKYKDTYGLNVFDGTVPKDLKEYDERFAYLKGSKLNKEQAKEIFDLLKKYQDEVLMDMAMRNPNKANRLYKQTNQLLENLKKYS
jgi:hypothetical protein